MYSLYSAHVMSSHCCMFTEHYHFNIFGIEWDRNIIITVISDNLSHSQGRWLLYFSFTKLKRRPNDHVTAATAHYYISRAAVLVLEIYLSYYHLLSQAIMPILNWLEENNHTVDLYKSSIPAWPYKVFYIKLITNSMMGIVVVPCVHLSVPNDATSRNL